MSTADALNIGLAVMGYFFIMFKTGEFFVRNVLKEFYKRRKQSRQQKAVSELLDAFDLNDLEPGSTVRLATKESVTIMMYRQGS